MPCPGRRAPARSRVAEKDDAALRPALDVRGGDRVDVEVVGGVEPGEHAVGLPAHVREPLVEQAFLEVDVAPLRAEGHAGRDESARPAPAGDHADRHRAAGLAVDDRPALDADGIAEAVQLATR